MPLNSLVTGPNILVAIGSSCLSNSTAAFLSNRIAVPSDLWKSFEKNEISLSEARESNKLLDESSDEKMQAKMKEFGKK